MRHITEGLGLLLPADYRQALKILRPVAVRFADFDLSFFFPDFVEVYGLDDYDTSVSAMEHFTKYSSSEFAVRPFIIRYDDRMMKQMEDWAESDNDHVRRLSSEGCRPRLPWATALPQFKKNPAPVLRILEKLKADESEYVRRSVANNLNDISRDNPKIVLNVSKQWLGFSTETDRLVKHACRSLLRAGDTRALGLFGYRSPKHIKISKLSASKRVRIGDDMSFSFVLSSSHSGLGKLRIEYAIDFVKANKTRARKVFKVSEGDYVEKTKEISRRHSFRKISTRKYYPGTHMMTIIINGKEMAQKEFVLEG